MLHIINVSHLLAPVVLNALSILQHFSTPELEEVIRISVELPGIPTVVAEFVEAFERRRAVATRVRLQHGRRHCVPAEKLLLKLPRRTERLAHLDVLDRY